MPTTIIPPNDPNSVSEASFIHTKAILFATFSLLVALLICPCLTWHFRNRNIGATVLVAAAIYSNFQNFLNAVIWPSDSPATWFNGVGLCDVEVKLQLFLQCVFPAAISCILRALAAVMDTERSTMAWGRTKAQRRRGYALDLVCCVGIPSLQMPIHYIVQPFRYYIFGITGCYASADTNWFMFVFLLGHPLLWTLVDVYYSVLIIIRLVRYRLNFRTILANNKTTRSRFLRLYILCALCSFVYFPINIWIFYANAQGEMQPFSWTRIHHPTAYSWNSAVMVPNNGELLWDRYVWLAGGALVFILFGFGRDAIKMYRDTLLSLGFGKIFPDLIPGERSSVMASMSSMGSKAKVLWGKRKGSETSTSFAGTKAHSLGSTTDDEMSPRKTSFVLETIVETRARAQDGEQKHNTRDGSWDRFTKRFREASATPNPPKEPSDHFIVTQVENQQRVEATISSEPDWRTRRSTGAGGDGQVLVHKEVRQNSETA